ncbi:hypothetical protein GWI33_006368 [Rhynchophorus ferrugineus]|uniref:Uncharacterized protein n=1 Tax=Rhynchophorus ferrugineus TaxID=354439 RepID=A0A834IBI8_RHYFE|nr:hypothetical protein GWI33_006368 [Rhynchophorus ferrugineus]
MNVYNQTASARGANQTVAIASDVSMNVYNQTANARGANQSIVYQATITTLQREHAQPSEPVEYLQSGHQHGASIIHYNQMNTFEIRALLDSNSHANLMGVCNQTAIIRGNPVAVAN